MVRVALSDVAFAMVGNLGKIAEAQICRRERPKDGNYLYGAFGRDFLTKEGRRIMIVAFTLRQWRSLVEATGLDEAFETLERMLDLDLDKEGDRFVAREVIGATIKPWTTARTLDEIREVFDAHGVCWGPYQTFMELVDRRSALLDRQPDVRRGRAAGDRHLPDGGLAAGASVGWSACQCAAPRCSASTPRRCSRRCSGSAMLRSDGCTRMAWSRPRAPIAA